jgi:ribose transport system substrate-binding protein
MRLTKSTLGAILCAILTVGLAACGSSSSSSGNGSSSSSAASGSSTSSAGSAGISAAQALVASGAALATKFSAPGPPINGGKAAYVGKTVWYIPITSLPPWFQIQAKVQQSVWSMLGDTLMVCDAKGSPTSASACLRQAVASKAAAIITDAIPVPFAQDAFTAAVNAHIPVVGGYVNPAIAPTNGSFRKYFHPLSGEETPTQELGAADLIVASGGKANVFVAGSSDTPSAAAASTAAEQYLQTNCTGCTVSSTSVQTVGNPNLASEVSGQLLSHPNANYFYTPYEAPSGTVFLQAIRQTGRKLAFMSTAGDPSGLQRVRSGGQVGDVGLDPVYQGWNYVDAALRAITGMPSGTYKGLVHLFTKNNVPQNPTLAGWLSGKWYSNLAFQQIYKQTWGLH